MNHSKQIFQYLWGFPDCSLLYLSSSELKLFSIFPAPRRSSRHVKSVPQFWIIKRGFSTCSCHNGFETIRKFKRDADCCDKHNRFVLTKKADGCHWHDFVNTHSFTWISTLVGNISIKIFIICKTVQPEEKYYNTSHRPCFVFQPHR